MALQINLLLLSQTIWIILSSFLFFKIKSLKISNADKVRD